MMQLVVLTPGGILQVHTVSSTTCALAALQTLVHGPLELHELPIQDFKGMHAYVNEEIIYQQGTTQVNYAFSNKVKKVVLGHVVFSRSNKFGDDIGISSSDILHLEQMFLAI